MTHACSHILMLTLICLASFANAQPSRDWDKTLGGENWDELHVVLPTADGGYLIGGNVTGKGGEVSQPVFGLNDFWLLRTDANGNKLWDKVYGGSGNDLLWSIAPLPEGGFLVGGSSSSDVSGNKTTPGRGKADFWVFKISDSGEKLWEKTIGGSGDDQLFAVRTFQDSTWLLAGFSDSPADGDKNSDSLGMQDVWILKIDRSGDIAWQKTFGGSKLDNLYDAVATADGGFLLGCASASEKTATKTQDAAGWADFWVIKINEDGEQEWDARFGGSNVEQLEQILPLRDGNYLLLGASSSPPGADHSAFNYGSFDFWAIKMDASGKKIWDKSYGGSKFDGAFKAVETRSGHILLAGVSDSPANFSKKSPNLGGYDYWLVYTDAYGNQLWDKAYGGSKYDAMTEIVQTQNGSLLLAGHSESPVSSYKSEQPRGHNDFWLLKTWCGIEAPLPPDTLFCSNMPVQFSVDPQNCASGDCQVYWSTGQTGESVLVAPDSAGLLWAFSEDRHACIFEDTVSFKVLPAPLVDLGPDTSIFADGGALFLDVFQPNATFEWQNGDNAPFFTATKTGTYAVTVTSDNGCTASDEIAVCACDERLLFIPNVFQPDGDVFNDTWYIQSKPGAVESLERIEVYDRWGHRVFRANNAQPNDKTFGWDGYDNGFRCVPAVYTYAVQVRFSANRTEILYGTIALVR